MPIFLRWKSFQCRCLQFLCLSASDMSSSLPTRFPLWFYIKKTLKDTVPSKTLIRDWNRSHYWYLCWECCNNKRIVKSYHFWDMMLCSPLKFNRRFGKTCHLHFKSRRKSQATSDDFQRTTRRYIPEDRTHNHRCENLISNIRLKNFALRLQKLEV
jgi:hypothetical protein